MFILSEAYLFLNAALYDREILHTDAWRRCAGHLLGFMPIGVVKNDILQKNNLHVGLQQCRSQRAYKPSWPRPVLL